MLTWIETVRGETVTGGRGTSVEVRHEAQQHVGAQPRTLHQLQCEDHLPPPPQHPPLLQLHQPQLGSHAGLPLHLHD